MEVSASEIGILSKRIDEQVKGYTLSGAYSIEGGVLLRLRHETKRELLIAISSFAAWITSKNLTLPQAEPFVSRLREIIERSRLVGAKQAGNERIIEFSFESKTEETSSLFAEFFGGGNLVLVDDKGLIVDAEKAQRFKHRSIISGEKYLLPPLRGLSLNELDESSLISLLERSENADRNLSAIKWFGRNVGTSRKFVEEIFYRSGLNPSIPLASVSRSDLTLLANTASDLLGSLESSSKGYLLLPKDRYENIDLDVGSLVPHSWIVLIDEGKVVVQDYETLAEALDEAQVQVLVHEKKSRASRDFRGRVAELESAISKQEMLLEKNSSDASKLRELAGELMQTVSQGLDPSFEGRLEALGIIEKDPSGGGGYRFVNDPRRFVASLYTNRAVASRLFDEAKTLEEKNRNISLIRGELERRKSSLREQSLATEERATKRIAFDRRAKEWFERYRWFLTSDLRLAVGGRDSTSNSIVINKYTEPGEFVFHADLHGSPFFVLKGKQSAPKVLSSEVEMEVAQATVSFSRGWKEELGSADAFWVRPDQVKKSAPSGEYLPRGSFFIEGKKNFVKHLRLELSLGIMTSDKLPLEDSSMGGRDTSIQPVVVCGPDKALSRYCIARSKIAPGREKGTTIARRVKQNLVGKVKDKALKEAVKKLSIDDFVKVLPSGNYKLVSEKQNG